MRNLRTAVYGLLTIVFVALLASCGTKNDGALLSRVPGDASTVMTVNFKKLFKEAGVPSPVSERGDWDEAAGRIASTFCPPDFMGAMTLCAAKKSSAEIDHVVIFEMADGTGGWLVKVNDPERLIERATGTDDAEAEEVEDYKVFTLPQMGGVMAVDGNVALFTQSVGAVEKFVNALKQQRIEEVEGVRQFLNEADEAVSFALNCNTSPSQATILGARDRWLCAEMEPNAQAVKLEAKVMDRGGRLDSIGATFEPIDQRVLTFIPGDAVAVLAFGRFIHDATMLNQLVQMYMPFMSVSSVGTTAVSASPAGGAEALKNLSIGAWNLVDAVKVAPDERQELLERAKDNPVFEQVGRDQWATPYLGGSRLYLGEFDGYFVTSLNREISPDQNNSFAQDFDGKHLAAVVNVPVGSDMQRAMGLPFGMTLTVGLQATKLKVRLTFNGTDLPALQALGQVISGAFDTYGNMFSPTEIFLPGMSRNKAVESEFDEMPDELEGMELEPIE